MKNERALKDAFSDRVETLQPKEEQIEAYMGRQDGKVRVPNRANFVYVRRLNGEVIQAFNDTVPAVKDRPIYIVHRKHWYVTGPRNTFVQPQLLIPDGYAGMNPFPSANAPLIAWQQYLPGLIQPFGGLVLRVWGMNFDISGTIVNIPTQNIDMTAHIPASGARWVRIEANAGGLSVLDGSVVADPSLITQADIPAPSAGKNTWWIIKLSAGKTDFSNYYDFQNTDFIDLRFGGGGGGGGVTPVNPSVADNFVSFADTIGGQKDSGKKAADFVAANVPFAGATKTKITYDAKGLVTAGADATAADVGAPALVSPSVTDNIVVFSNLVGLQKDSGISGLLFSRTFAPQGWDAGQIWSYATVAVVSTTKLRITVSASANIAYHWRGVYKNLGATSLQVTSTDDKAEGIWFCFSSDGVNFILTQTPFHIFDLISGAIRADIMLWEFYWDNTNNTTLWIQPEFHPSAFFSPSIHGYAHESFGTRYSNGLDITYGLTASNADTRVKITNGEIHDEGISVYINHSATPTAIWEQILSAAGTADSSYAALPIYYLSGATPVWRKIAATSYPFQPVSNNYMYYNRNNAGTWDYTSPVTSNYAVGWIVATSNQTEPIVVIPGRGSYATQTAAEAEIFPNLSTLFTEFKLLYRIIYQTKNGSTNNGKCQILTVTDYRKDIVSNNATSGGSVSAAQVSFTPSGGIAATNVQAALEELDTEKAALASPTFTGTPAAPTAAAGTNTTQLATTAMVQGEKFIFSAGAYDVMSVASSGYSDFVGTVTTIAGDRLSFTFGTTSGNKNAMVPVATNHLAKMRLWNTTRNSYILISNCTATTVTPYAAVPAAWANGDAITIRSQTVNGTYSSGYFVDFEFVSGPPLTALGIKMSCRLVDTGGAGYEAAFHPMSSFSASQQTMQITTQGTGVIRAQGDTPLTGATFSCIWIASGAATLSFLIRLVGYYPV